ncbi:superoxide dismutase [Iamia sp.]|uniref:superoxide dismutase n=1 Tax=Iamia sp. TaxID=2722710 RepID=UPI002CB3E77C|nr:superoxide dismutase [Iamia sp.]HXH56861.1 superoxide dismutase [Iamia sp.]
MAFTLPDLPYAQDALAPHVSAETLEYHHGKHHKAYVDKLNELIDGTEHADASLEAIIKASDGPLFNQAGQHWNHSFYWKCMAPGGGGEPTGELADKISSAFGGYAAFREEFIAAGMGQFGSGWAWLADDGEGGLQIMKTPNADLPLAHDVNALLTVDVWEHAYYIDFRNKRPDYLNTFLDSLVNWDFVASNLR